RRARRRVCNEKVFVLLSWYKRTKRSKLFIKEITPLLFVTFAFFLRLFWKVYNMWFFTPLFWDGLCGFEVFKPLKRFGYPLHFHSPRFKPWAMVGYCFL